MEDLKKPEFNVPKASPAEIREFNIESLTFLAKQENPNLSLDEARKRALEEIREDEKGEEDFKKYSNSK